VTELLVQVKKQLEQSQHQMEQSHRQLEQSQRQLEQSQREVKALKQQVEVLTKRVEQTPVAAARGVAPAPDAKDVVVMLPGTNTSLGFHGYAKLDIIHDASTPNGCSSRILAPTNSSKTATGPVP
jgi:hypothetical protein